MCIGTSWVHLKRGAEISVEIPRPIAGLYPVDVINETLNDIEDGLKDRGVDVTIAAPKHEEPHLFTIVAHEAVALDPRLVVAAVLAATFDTHGAIA